jgi:phosphoribosyl-ATP pyrophosphohydrolase/phosphoribosyl-AMP cyclohydrolase/histidinol dehydrogenase
VEATEPDHVAAEAADVMYFMMTRCVAAGVGMKEIADHLDRRTLKVGLKLQGYYRQRFFE